MFSSNQKFCVSCDDGQLSDVVRLAMAMECKNQNKSKLAYQLTSDGKFVIGWYFNEPKKGWSKFMFDNPSNDLVISAIKQFVAEHPCHDAEDYGDGSVSPGYLVEAVENSFAEECNGIKNSFYGIISIRAFNCFYHK